MIDPQFKRFFRNYFGNDNLREYGMEGERPTRFVSLGTDTNTWGTDQIGLDMLYQAYITDCINISI